MKRLTIPITNGRTTELLLELEPEGETIAIKPGENCVVTLETPSLEDAGVALEIKDDLLLLYAMCRKSVRV